MTQTNNYDKLYENMKQRFTVSADNQEFTLGEYMLMKAESKKPTSPALPVAVMNAVTKSETAVTSIVSFVDDKLTIKQAPVKDKTIKAFPFRASAAAFLTASVACAFVLSFALIGTKTLKTPAPTASDISITETVDNSTGASYSDIANK